MTKNHNINKLSYILCLTFAIISIGLSSASAQSQDQTGNPNANLYPVHDPVMIKQDKTYYLFSTGGGCSSSTDMVNWKNEKNVFDNVPAWITPDIVKVEWGNGIAAPDIQYIKGTYYYFYCVSSFAVNTSAIGVATNKTLHQDSPDYKWIDHGMIIQSIPNRDMWNALDPNVIMDGNQGWLVFGSFWNGIKMVKLSKDLFSVAKPEVWRTLARQPRAFPLDDTDPGDGTIEAPFIMKTGGYFYLFASLDYCCRGLLSDYNVIVGRSKKVGGPYLDKDGKLLVNGGGTVIAKGNDDWTGVGHSAHYIMDKKSIMIMHGYDKRDNGRSKLIIREMNWSSDGWPSIIL